MTSSQFSSDFVATLSRLGVSPEKQKEVFIDLSRAIAINAMSGLIDKLSPSAQQELESSARSAPEELFKFFSEKLSKAEVEKSIQQASETICTEFLKRLQS